MKFEDLPRDEKGKAIAAEVSFPIECDLLTPVQLEGRKLDKVVLREPLAGELEIANKEPTGTATAIRLVSFSIGLPPDDVRKLGIRDYLRFSGLLLDFN